MKTVAFIPIKLDNERLPGKNVKKFDDGTPLLALVLKKVSSLVGGCIDEAYVFCSDESIVRYLPPNIRFLKRSNVLDRKETKGTEIYRAFIDAVHADIYVLCHVTSPFVTVEHIEECIRAVQDGKGDSAFCAKKIQNFLWAEGEPLNFELSDPPRTQDMVPIYQEQSTPYVFSKSTFERYEARTGFDPYICVCDEIECVDIDDQEDFELANLIYMNLLKCQDGRSQRE